MSFDATKSKSISFQKLNPHLFGLASTERKPDPIPTLDPNPEVKAGGTRRLPARAPKWRVSIVAMRPRLLDSDNHIAGCKGLRDIIAAWLGMDDKDGPIQWEYGQVESRQGCTIVRAVQLTTSQNEKGVT